MPEGKGTYKWKEGGKYEGEWKKNKKCGKGKRIFANGSAYEGEWLNDKQHGKVIYLQYLFIY